MNRDLLEKPFDPEQIKQREGYLGDVLDYLEGPTVIQRLNEALNGVWSFDILEHRILDEEVVVLGKLSADGIVKTQFGKTKITRHRGTKQPLSLGDDCKAAATDCLKKCATLLGVGLHLYREAPAATPPGAPTATPSPSPNGERPSAPGDNGLPGRLTARQLAAIYALGKSQGKSNQDIKQYTLEVFNKVPDYLSRDEASTIIRMLQEGEAHG